MKNAKVKSWAIVLVLAGISFTLTAQQLVHPADIEPKEDFENIYSLKIAEDSLCSTFLIWVKIKVKPHKHLYHTEQIYVLEGEADMKMNDTVLHLLPGSYVIIPRGTVHEVSVVQGKTLKIISFQSPFFDGTDRVWVE